MNLLQCSAWILLITPIIRAEVDEIPVELLNVKIGLLKVQDQYDAKEVEECGILTAIKRFPSRYLVNYFKIYFKILQNYFLNAI